MSANTVPEGARVLLYKLLPLEVSLQLAALAFFALHFWNSVLATHSLQLFIGAVGIANLGRYLALSAIHHSRHSTNQRRVYQVHLAGNGLTGTVWGIGLPLLISINPAFSISDPIVPLLVISTTVASLLGSGFRAGLVLAYCMPALGCPLAWLLWHGDFTTCLVWGGAVILSSLLAHVGNHLYGLLEHYRRSGFQNKELMRKLANARDHALQHQQKIQTAHQKLQAQYQDLERAKDRLRISEQETTRILRDMHDMYFRVDAQGIVTRVSPSVEYLLGRLPDLVAGEPWRDVFIDEQEWRQFIAALNAGFGVIQNHECRFKHLFGHEVWVSMNAHYSGDGKDPSKGFEGTARNVTQQKRAAEALYQEKERLYVTLSSIGDGVITTNIKGVVEYLNPTAESMTGWSKDTALGKPLSAVLKVMDEDKKNLISLPMEEWLGQGQVSALANPVILTSASGREYSIELTGSPIRNSLGAVIGSVLVFHNVTHLRSLAKQLSYQASHDALTGLINRREFENRVGLAIESAQRERKEHVLLYIDLDRFKIVNDTCGHHAGDNLLRQITAKMQGKLRAADTLARLGGDEFGTLLTGCTVKRATDIAEDLRRSVEEFRFVWDDRVFRVGASIGLVPITHATASLTELLSAADAACYVAKDRGRNRVHVYQQNDARIAQHYGQIQWVQRIQQALEEDGFELSSQEIVPLKNPGDNPGFAEFLVRMRDDRDFSSRKLIHPNSFIPAAERHHLMPQIDRCVISKALDIIKEQIAHGEARKMYAINLSGQSLNDAELLDYVVQELNKTGIQPARLCFEISETALISDIEAGKEFILQLKNMGSHFALDDFGSGLAAFEYLQDLPIDFLKLDGGVVRNIDSNEVSYAMVESINRVAHVMGMKTIAENVESKEILQALKKISVDYAQGYAVESPRSLISSVEIKSKLAV